MLNSILYTNINLFSKQQSKNKQTNSPNFCGCSSKKLIDKILKTKNFKELKITFDELCRIYNHLGYDVTLKRGSHAIVSINNTNIPIVIPHKDKYVTNYDIKRLKLIMNGEVEKAKHV